MTSLWRHNGCHVHDFILITRQRQGEKSLLKKNQCLGSYTFVDNIVLHCHRKKGDLENLHKKMKMNMTDDIFLINYLSLNKKNCIWTMFIHHNYLKTDICCI